MGVEYYVFAPKENIIYDVGKDSSFQYFRSYLSSLHQEWVRIHENDFNWFQPMGDEEYPIDQTYIDYIEDDDRRIEMRYTIPKDVPKVDCFGESFKQAHEAWQYRQRKMEEYLNEPLEIPDELWNVATKGTEQERQAVIKRLEGST